MRKPDNCRENKGPCLNGRLYSWQRHQVERADLLTVIQWLESGHNLGVVTGAISGLVVVDLDNSAAVSWAHGHLPPTPIRVATSAGEHWYYRAPAERVANHQDKSRGIDIRGEGGYVVVPYSMHSSGHVYRPVGSWRGPLPYYPAHVFARLWPRVRAGAAALMETADTCRHHRVRAWVARYPGSGKGGRDAAAYKLACWLTVNFALTDDEALTHLLSWNERNQPPLAEHQLFAKLQKARRYARREVGAL